MATNPIVLKLASEVGVRIADRACDNNYIFDGQTIATHFFPCHWVRNGKLTEYGTPDEDFVRSGKPACYFLDHDMLHEVMHFAAAAPEQRDLPEFGLGYIGSFCQNPVPRVVDHLESETQEKTTQLLCCFFGSKFGLSLPLAGEPDFTTKFNIDTWKAYMDFKWRAGDPLCEEASRRSSKIIADLGY